MCQDEGLAACLRSSTHADAVAPAFGFEHPPPVCLAVSSSRRRCRQPWHRSVHTVREQEFKHQNLRVRMQIFVDRPNDLIPII